MDEFEAMPMRGTSFDIDDEEDDAFMMRIKGGSSVRRVSEIEDMIEQITQRMGYYETVYKRAKRAKNQNDMVIALRNFKALEGARQSLRWVLKDPLVDHPLF